MGNRFALGTQGEKCDVSVKACRPHCLAEDEGTRVSRDLRMQSSAVFRHQQTEVKSQWLHLNERVVLWIQAAAEDWCITCSVLFMCVCIHTYINTHIERASERERIFYSKTRLTSEETKLGTEIRRGLASQFSRANTLCISTARVTKWLLTALVQQSDTVCQLTLAGGLQTSWLKHLLPTVCWKRQRKMFWWDHSVAVSSISMSG